MWLLGFEREIGISQDYRANLVVGGKETHGSLELKFSVHLLPEKNVRKPNKITYSRSTKKGKSRCVFVWQLFSETAQNLVSRRSILSIFRERERIHGVVFLQDTV